MKKRTNLYFRSLTKKDLAVISMLDPFMIGKLLVLPSGFGIGALLQEGEDLSIVGMVIGTVSEEAIYIEWMAVASDLQYKQIGEELLKQVFELALSLDKEKVHAVIHSRHLKNPFAYECDRYFKEHLFEEETVVGEDICITLDTIAQSNLIKMGQSIMDPEYISGIPRQKKYELINKLEGMWDASRSPDRGAFDRNMDEDISVVLMHGDIIVGALLVYRSDDLLLPCFLYTKNGKFLQPVVYGAFMAAVKKYGKGQRVRITQRNEMSIAACEKMFGPAKPMTLLTAYTEDYPG